MASGGYNRIDFIGVKDDHSGIVQLDADMALTGTAASLFAHIGLTIQKNFGVTITPTKLNVGRSFSLDQDHDGNEIRKLIDNFIVSDDTTNTEYYCDGTAASAVAAGTTEHNVVAVVYDVLDDDDSANMLVYLILGGFKEGSGAKTGKYQERMKPTVEFISKKAKATITIPAAMFDSALVTVGSAQTIASGDDFSMLELVAA